MSSPTQPEPAPAEDDFVPTDELIRRQGVKPFRSLDDLLGPAPRVDPFGSDEEHAAFLTDLYASRHAST